MTVFIHKNEGGIILFGGAMPPLPPYTTLHTHLHTPAYMFTGSIYVCLLVYVCWCCCSVKFDDFEHVTCMKVGSLRSSETVSGRKNFIMVGTCDVRTEEVSSKGKVRLCVFQSFVTCQTFLYNSVHRMCWIFRGIPFSQISDFHILWGLFSWYPL